MKKVAVLTLKGYFNYGNRLQKYALSKILHDMGLEVYSIWDKDLVGKTKEFIVSSAIFLKKYDRLRKFYKISHMYSKEINVDEVEKNGIDMVVVGSDQVWNPEYYERDHNLLYRAKNGEKVISYAASIGRAEIPDEYRDLYRDVISKYDALSVREKQAEEEIKKLTGRKDVITVLDPTLLLSRQEWESMEEKPEIYKENMKYVLCCFLGKMPEEERADIEEYAKRNDCFIINILDPNDPFSKISGPQNFIYLIHHAQLVCTDSFHASVFSFIYDRPLVVFKRVGKSDYMYSRLQNLLDVFQLENREYKGRITDDQIEHDYSAGYRIREAEARKGKDFLYKCIWGKRAIRIHDKAACSGCGACAEVCPKQCIKLKTDSEGFWYPSANLKECIDCGLCLHTCPIINIKSDDRREAQEFRIGYSKDEEARTDSSSGGIFTALASEVIENGGVVFGAAFDDDFMVHHVKAETADDLVKLRGSKYVQSRTEHTFAQAREVLEEGRTVLYAGTGCQIAGLKAYLKRDYDNLLTVDLICHGVPSPKLWRKYLDEQIGQYGANVSDVNFRKKTQGWKEFSLAIGFENGKHYEAVFRKDPYMKLFLNDICLRPSCHACKFKPVHSQADITIGDCWDIGKIKPEMDDDKGISEVHVHTAKGKEYINKIKEQVVLESPECGKSLQQMAFRSTTPHIRRSKFFSEFKKGESTVELVKLVPLKTIDKVEGKLKQIFRR